MDLAKAVIVEVPNATLDVVLHEMAQTKPGGIVLLVCHAWNEGLLMPVAAGSRLTSGKAAIARLSDVSAAERKARTIRAMPSKTSPEIKAKTKAWVRLSDEVAAGTIRGEVTFREVERLYEDWLDEVAKNELFLVGNPRAVLKRLVERMEKVQSMRLERVELRACNIGAFTSSMKKTKELFGCGKLLAPTVGTFYLKDVPITNLKGFDRRYIRQHRVGNFRPPGPIGSSFKDPEDYLLDVIKKNPSARIFWDYEFGYIPPANPHPAPNKYDSGTSTTKMKRVVAMIVEEVKEFYFRGSGATWNETKAHNPQWEDARQFVRDYIMRDSKYNKGSLKLSGFWTPGEPDPWLLPIDAAYKDHIRQV
jgi:hypothetical protein